VSDVAGSSTRDLTMFSKLCGLAGGTVNLETAKKLGWNRVWREHERPTGVARPE